MKRLYVFIGLPLSGKSFAAKLFAQKVTDSTYLSTGDLVRQIMTPDLKDQTAKNDLFPIEDKVRELIEQFIENSVQQNVIIDGFPRYGAQAKWMCDTFSGLYPVAFHVNVGDLSTIYLRAKSRARDEFDTNSMKLAVRTASASKNLSDALLVLNARLVKVYNIISTDTPIVHKQLDKIIDDGGLLL